VEARARTARGDTGRATAKAAAGTIHIETPFLTVPTHFSTEALMLAPVPHTSSTPRMYLFALGGLLLQAACAGGSDTQSEAKAAEPAAQARSGTTAGREVDWKAVDAALGRTGTMQPGNVYRYGMPRSDMRVTVEGVPIKPGFALGSWLAMTPTANGVMAMGDMVLKEDEVAPVMTALQAGGVEQTAVHHHVLHETPRVLYMHVHAMGDPVKIAQTVRSALERTGTPAQAPAAAPAGGDQGDGAGAGRPGSGGEALDLDTGAVARALGRSGKVNGGVYQVSVPRAETIRDRGMEVPPSMGLATAINFQPTGGGKAAITGDFVMIASEVNPVIRALREHGIEVTSLHNHLLAEEPRLFFMHFWANDDAVKLARGLRAALDKTNSRAPGAQ
jgi:surface antigen